MSALKMEVRSNGEIYEGSTKVGELLDLNADPKVMTHKLIENGDAVYILFEKGSKDPAYAGYKGGDHRIARIDKASKKVMWRAYLGHEDHIYGPIFYKNTVVAGFSNVLYGFDATSGKQLWVYSIYNGHEEAFAIKKLTLEKDTLFVEGEDWGQAKQIELLAETGDRVYKKTQQKKLNPEPIYSEEIRKQLVQQDFQSWSGARGHMPMPKVGKGKEPEAPTRPEVPVDWDSFRLGVTVLTYNKVKKEGIIIDPIRTNAATVIETAKKLKDIKWLYVIDSLKVSEASPKYVRARVMGDLEKKYPKPKQLIFEESFFSLDARLAGERIDTKTVADALNAKVLDGKLDTVLMTESGPIIPHSKDEGSFGMDPDRQGSFLAIEWGPYRIGLTHSSLSSKFSNY